MLAPRGTRFDDVLRHIVREQTKGEIHMPALLSPIEAHESNIGQIFSDSYSFEIPPYQRPYAWEEDQARELLSDLLNAMDNTAASGSIYFLGSIVLIKSPGLPQSKVIDGQQRLTTLTILLSVIRDLTSDIETRIERRRYIFQKGSADKGTQDRFRLTLRPRDQAFFRKYIQQPDATDSLPDPSVLTGSEKRLVENACYFRGQLQAADETRRNRLVAFIIQHCYLVVVAVPTPDAARRIFTVLNARGLDLTATDILKADLLERAGAAAEVPLAERWESVEQSLGRDKFVELFGHIRMIYEREKPRSALEDGFRPAVPLFSGDAETFISDLLEPTADAYMLLNDPNQIEVHFGPEAAKAVRSLQRIDNKDWMPPALLRLWRLRQGEGPAVAQFLPDLERLAYFLFVTRTDINVRMARFANVMDEYEPRPSVTAPQGLALSSAEEDAFVSALSGPLYTLSRVCRPVLQRLDEALSSGGASYDNLISIEHVLPQTVDDGSTWAALFPDVTNRTAWTHRLANLVFLTRRINIRASNWDFERKKKEYFVSKKDGTSPFPLTQGVLRASHWTPEYLTTRQQDLLETLCKLWRLPAPAPVKSATA
jgi:Protein of unknown function DUF262/Protein of unknown function (DUF1524)